MEGKSEIAVIFNNYKDTVDNLINSSDTKSLDWPDFPNRLKLIDKELRNTLKSKSGSLTLLGEDCLIEDVSIMSLKPMPKI